MELRHKNILMISPTPWDVTMPARQHYARELAKTGNKVYYLNPPSKLNSVTELSENIYIVDYREAGSFFGLFKDAAKSKEINKILSVVSEKIDIIWSFDYNRFPDLSKFGAGAIKIFTIEDWLQDDEQQLLVANSADLVLCLSQPLLDKLGTIRGQKQLFNHSLGTAFVDALQKAESIRANTQFATGRIRCGYLGNLQNKYIDTLAFESIIKNNPIVEFHLIGPFVKESNLAGSGNKTWEDPFVEFLMSAPNVRMYGSLMTVRTAEILQTMDMFLVCYNTEQYANQVANPPKIMEYFSTGKTVVASYTKSCEAQKDLLLMSDKNQELSSLFKQAVDNIEHFNRAESAQKRIDFALQHTYDKQLQKIEQILTNLGK